MSITRRSITAPLVAASFALGVAGCSGYDVELNGGIFDLVGISDIGKKRAEPKLDKRNGIIVPPTTAALPPPGGRPQPTGSQVAAANGQAWPVDPEIAKADQKQALLKQHLAFCAKARQRFAAQLDSFLQDGPLGSCDESVIRSFTGKDLYRRPATNSTEAKQQQ